MKKKNWVPVLSPSLLLHSRPSSPPQSAVSPCSHLHSSSSIADQCSCCSPSYSLTHFLFPPPPPNLVYFPLILDSRVGFLFSPSFVEFPDIFLFSPYSALLRVLVFSAHLYRLLFSGAFSCLRVLLDVFVLLGVFG